MDDDSLWLLLGLLVLATPILAITAFVRTLSQRRLLNELRDALARQGREIAGLRRELGGEPIVEPVPPPRPEFVAAAPPREEAQMLAETLLSPPPPAPPPPPPRAPAPERENLENALTSRWLVWLGALAIALAGIFLVKYAIEEHLLTPAARIALGLMLGLGLAVAGEVLRQRPLQRAIAAVRPNHVPPALTASGLFVAFASIYSAYALYHLVGALVAFAGLAAVALLAVGLSLLQGRFVALTGLFGAFAAPALVATPHPSVWALFTYFLVVEGACLAVARTMRWWWYALATLGGVALWPLLWMLDAPFHPADGLPLALYLLASALFYIALHAGITPAEDGDVNPSGWRHMQWPERTVATAGGILGLLLFLVANACGFTDATLVVSALFFLLYLLAGRRDGYVDILAVIAAAVALALMATIPVPASIAAPAPFAHSPLVPFALETFAISAVGFGALFAVAGFVALWGARRPALWAGVSAGVPVALLAIGYWRIVAFGVDLTWAAIGVGLAGVALAAAARVERYREVRGLEISLGFYAASVVACISLAAAMSLREAWLSVALAIELPALGWIARQVSARSIRIIAGIVVSIVIVRLALNYNILSYGGGFAWILYGYGIPAAACFVAAREFARAGRDMLVVALEAAALAFAVLLVSLEIRMFVTGALDAAKYPLLEQALQSIAWLSTGTALALRDARAPNPVAHYGARILLALAAFQVIVLQLLVCNPMATGEPVGAYPLVNALSFAYLIPAAFAFILATRLPAGEGPLKWARAGAAIAGFVLVFADISFEVRRAFHGAVLTTPSHGDAELYTYSAAWIVYAVVLLALGLLKRLALVRYAALAVLMIAAIKVFLVDMGDLTGLYRVTSFLGLGLSLVGIGYLYQRFVTATPKGA